MQDIISKIWKQYGRWIVAAGFLLLFIYAGQVIIQKYHISAAKELIFWPIYLGLVWWLVIEEILFKKIKKIKSPKDTDINQKLAHLEKAGIALAPGIMIKDIPEELNDGTYESLLIAMGGELEEKNRQWMPLSSDIWHFDTECIEDHGDYARIAARLSEITKGGLPLQNIRDFVDIEAKTAWLSFILDGKEYKWDLKVDDDWIDTELFSKFAKLLRDHNPEKNFAYMSLGQDALIICCTFEQLKLLNKLPGIKFRFEKILFFSSYNSSGYTLYSILCAVFNAISSP